VIPAGRLAVKCEELSLSKTGSIGDLFVISAPDELRWCRVQQICCLH
jgi:hypothetical protein